MAGRRHVLNACVAVALVRGVAMRPNEPTFRVVLPTYNREEIVLDAVNSVLVPAWPDFGLIVVDDLSTDDTQAVLAQIEDTRAMRLASAERSWR